MCVCVIEKREVLRGWDDDDDIFSSPPLLLSLLLVLVVGSWFLLLVVTVCVGTFNDVVLEVTRFLSYTTH